MEISVIIPAYNEESIIASTIQSMLNSSASGCIKEIIVVDGGSRDATIEEVRKTPAKVVISPARSRASQMNFGASKASGKIFYFLHADSIPPKNFDKKIINEIEDGSPAGCFRLAFDHDHFLLNFYAWCTRFDVDAFRFGDQSLFISRHLFEKIGGFREDHILMEDSEIIKRIKKAGAFCIIPDQVTTSSRRYLKNGIIKLQLIFTLIFILYKIGVSQSKLALIYDKLIH